MGRSEGKAAPPVEREVLDRLEKEAESLVANVTSEVSGGCLQLVTHSTHTLAVTGVWRVLSQICGFSNFQHM